MDKIKIKNKNFFCSEEAKGVSLKILGLNEEKTHYKIDIIKEDTYKDGSTLFAKKFIMIGVDSEGVNFLKKSIFDGPYIMADFFDLLRVQVEELMAIVEKEKEEEKYKK